MIERSRLAKKKITLFPTRFSLRSTAQLEVSPPLSQRRGDLLRCTLLSSKSRELGSAGNHSSPELLVCSSLSLLLLGDAGRAVARRAARRDAARRGGANLFLQKSLKYFLLNHLIRIFSLRDTETERLRLLLVYQIEKRCQNVGVSRRCFAFSDLQTRHSVV